MLVGILGPDLTHTLAKDRWSATRVNQDRQRLLPCTPFLSLHAQCLQELPRAYPTIPRNGHVIRYFFSFNKCTLGSPRNYLKAFGDKFKYILIYPSKKLNQDALYYLLFSSVGLAVISGILVFFLLFSTQVYWLGVHKKLGGGTAGTADPN